MENHNNIVRRTSNQYKYIHNFTFFGTSFSFIDSNFNIELVLNKITLSRNTKITER